MNSTNFQFCISILISTALAIWNFNQQKKLEGLKRDKDKQLIVHKLQFDKEFSIYNEIWNNLVGLCNIISQLRPEGDIQDSNRTYGEVISERVLRAIEIGNTTITIVENNKPFYSKRVYTQLQSIIKIIKTEIIATQHQNINSEEYWISGAINVERLVTLNNQVCEEIRNRIGSIEMK